MSGNAGGCGADELVEYGAVLDHCGAEYFSGGLHEAWTDGDAVGEAIVLHHVWVSNGDVGGALIKAVLGIAAGEQEGVDEVVGFSDGCLGVVDEAGLKAVPLDDEAFALSGAKVADFQGLDAGFAVSEF